VRQFVSVLGVAYGIDADALGDCGDDFSVALYLDPASA
jgi:hypothetical protein